MRYKATVDEATGTIVWDNGREPVAKEFGAPSLIGIPFSDFRKEYRAHLDKYPDAESNIKYCEMVSGVSRNDFTTREMKR